VARAAVNAELFKVAVRLGRNTWYASLAFGLLAVLLLWREGRVPVAAAWWTTLALAVVVRVAYCQRTMTALASDSRRTPPRADGYAMVAAAEGVIWAMLLVVLPSASEFGLGFQLGLTMLVLLGVLLPFAPAGLPWVAFAVPVGFAQLVALLSRELPQHELTILTWAMTLVGAALTAQWLKRALSNNLSLRHRADLAARSQEQANAELNRSREQLRIALDAIDAGIADTNLITGERFFSPRYFGILGYEDRDTFLKEYRLSEALHPTIASACSRRGACMSRLVRRCVRSADSAGPTAAYVWVILRGESVRGTDGKPTRLVLSIVDNTEHRIAQLQLVDSERRYRALVEASPSLIWVCDDKGKLTFVSERAAGTCSASSRAMSSGAMWPASMGRDSPAASSCGGSRRRCTVARCSRWKPCCATGVARRCTSASAHCR